MKGIILSSVVSALVIFSGCSSKEVAVDSKKPEAKSTVKQEVIQEIAETQTETISPEHGMVDSTNGNNVMYGETLSTKESSYANSSSSSSSKLPVVYFAFDKYNISQKMQEKIDYAVKLLKSDTKIKLEGNCDEWGSDEYNFALGLKRANAVKQAMIAEGIDASNISMVSYGENSPVCTDKTQECWAKNRRVDFKIIP